jgi:uncharacterized protein
MRILTVSDDISQILESPAIVEQTRGVDLVLSCGDLPADYLEYIVTNLNVPLYYVMGNHGGAGGDREFPEGCDNIDQRIVEYKGLLIAGLEGVPRYNNKPQYQYSETEMSARIAALSPALLVNRARHGRFLDILITHAPPLHVHDGQDYAHRGFQSFVWFMEHYKPTYLIHGHKHVYDNREQVVTVYGATTVINTYKYKILEVPVPQRVRMKTA